MNISITELSGLHDAITAAGIKALLEGVGIPVDVGQASTLSAPQAPLPAPAAAPKPVKRAAHKQLAPPPAKPKPATKATSDPPRVTNRDAVRAQLNTAGKDLTTMTQDVQRSRPDLGRDMIGTILCQLSKGGECSLDEDNKWRRA